MSEFEPGTVVCTMGVQQRIAEDPVLEEVFGGFLQRHLRGDWGDLDDEDKEMNDESLRMEREGKPADRLFSCYEYNGGRIYIITEWDRSATTLLLPEEYRNHKAPGEPGAILR